jgi:hypothetical protein
MNMNTFMCEDNTLKRHFNVYHMGVPIPPREKTKTFTLRNKTFNHVLPEYFFFLFKRTRRISFLENLTCQDPISPKTHLSCSCKRSHISYLCMYTQNTNKLPPKAACLSLSLPLCFSAL